MPTQPCIFDEGGEVYHTFVVNKRYLLTLPKFWGLTAGDVLEVDMKRLGFDEPWQTNILMRTRKISQASVGAVIPRRSVVLCDPGDVFICRIRLLRRWRRENPRSNGR